MQWTRIILPDEEKPSSPSWWFYPIMMLVSFTIFGIFTYSMNDNFSSLDNSTLLFGFILPSICGGLAMISFAIHLYTTGLDEYFYRLTFIEAKKREWQHWGRSSMQICACAQIAPVDDMTDKILGISGKILLNPNAVMKLNDIPANTFQQYSLSFILNGLIESMLEDINAVQKPLILHIYSPESLRVTQASVRQTIKYHNIKNIDEDNVHCLNKVLNFQEVYNLLEQSPVSYHLVIMVSLNKGFEKNTTESAVGLLLNTQPDSVESGAHFFRPLHTEKGTLTKNIIDFLEVEQTRGEESIHLWTVNVDGKSNHLLTGTVGNSTRNYSISGIYSMNTYFGKVSSIYAWNSIVCAVETIKSTGENSLIVLQQDENIECTQVAKLPAEMPEDNFYTMSGVHIYHLLGLMLFFLGSALFINSYSELASFLPWMGGIILIMFILSLISVPVHQNQLRKKCQREWNDAQNDNDVSQNE